MPASRPNAASLARKPGPLGAITERGSRQSGIVLGGLGSGGVEIWPDGRLYQWMFPNAAPWSGWHGHVMKAGPGDAPQPAPGDADFLVRVARKGKRPQYRWLFAGNGFALTTASHFWRVHKYFFIRAFPEIEYRAEYPFAHLAFRDPDFPVEVKLTAWTPSIPHEVKDSSLPGCCFDVQVVNRCKEAVEVSIVWQFANVAGFAVEGNTQEHTVTSDGNLTAVTMRGGLNQPEHNTSGDLTIWNRRHGRQQCDAIACNPYMQNLVWSLHRTGHLHGPLLPERLTNEEITRELKSWSPPNKGWLCVREKLAAGATTEANFGLTWNFPNHTLADGTRVGHQYSSWFADSLTSARYLGAERERLLEASQVLPRAVLDSTLPESLRLAMLDQLGTAVKNSHFIAGGRFGIQEGHGCCSFNTVDVDHYASYALSLLQPGLRRVINDMNQEMAHPDNGKMYHGHGKSVHARPAGGDAHGGYSRWDVCCQYALAVWRDAAWSGDRQAIDRHYPSVLRAVKLIASLDFYGIGLPYIEGGITYDHWHMKGAVGYLAGVYLASLRAVERMARLVGDAESAAWAHAAFARGLAGFEKHLWNGRQYCLFYGRRPKGWKPGDDPRGEPKHFEAVRPPEECCAGSACARADAFIEIGDTGTMTDLLNGDATARMMGLGSMLDVKRVNRYLDQVLERNVQEENDCLVNGSYPDDHFLDEWPFMQWQTPWTGTEYFFAAQLYAMGRTKDGDHIIDLVHRRHDRDGMRFDQAECNNHYARPLSIWGAYVARVGLEIDALDGLLGIVPPDGKAYAGVLATGTAIGRIEHRPGASLRITVERGVQAIRTLRLGAVRKEPKRLMVRLGKTTVPCAVTWAAGIATVALGSAVEIVPGTALEVRLA